MAAPRIDLLLWAHLHIWFPSDFLRSDINRRSQLGSNLPLTALRLVA